jgi:ribosomal protein S12 methylthiotransferase
VKELLIIGQDTTDYGKDLYKKRNLAELLNKLSEVKGIEWIKLLYAYPSHFPDDVIDTIANNPKVCNYLDMPLQHISDKVLKSMRRGITKRRTLELVNKLQEKIPDLTFRTTFIVGYPNETEEEFQELLDFVRETRFDRLGVFNYSIEETTPAFVLDDPVSEQEKESRKNRLMELQQEISYEKNKKLIGKKLKVIIDRVEGEYYVGRSAKDAPEVDGEVLIQKNGNSAKIGDFYSVEIFDCSEYDLFGKFV